MDKDLERKLNYIHGRINANTHSNHIALLCVKQMLEVLASDFSNGDRTNTAFRSIIANLATALDKANEEIDKMNAEFIDLIDSNDKPNSETKH